MAHATRGESLDYENMRGGQGSGQQASIVFKYEVVRMVERGISSSIYNMYHISSLILILFE